MRRYARVMEETLMDHTSTSLHYTVSMHVLQTAEDPCPPWSPSLLGPPCQGSAHQDHRSQGQDCRSVQEEINCLRLKTLINCSVEHLELFYSNLLPLSEK